MNALTLKLPCLIVLSLCHRVAASPPKVPPITEAERTKYRNRETLGAYMLIILPTYRVKLASYIYARYS